MSKYEIRKEIADLINSIKEHSDNIADNKYIPQLELESILHKIEKLYEKSIVFNYLNSLPEEKEVPILAEPAKEENVQKEQISVMEEMIEPPVSISTPPTTDLFGSELPPAVEKPKPEIKEEKKPEKITKVSKTAISDIKSAIGINDKFQFTNELFQGNTEEYLIAIQQLNSSDNFESAMSYFLSLKLLYNWNMENETVIRLLELVNRRFS